MNSFSLNTFIKICLLDTGGRISEIQKKLEKSGGYDFYNSFQRATRASLSGEKASHIQSILNGPTKDIERKYNKEIFDQVQTKFGSIRSLEEVTSKKSLKLRFADLEIVLDPLFRFERSGITRIYSVWPTQKPELTQKYAAVACYLMRETYKGTSLANAQFHYYDGVKDKTYSEKQINNNTSLILNADVASISKLIKEL